MAAASEPSFDDEGDIMIHISGITLPAHPANTNKLWMSTVQEGQAKTHKKHFSYTSERCGFYEAPFHVLSPSKAGHII